MPATSDSRPVEARLSAAIDELHEPAQQHGREKLQSGGYREDAIERLHRTWDVLDINDLRWDAITALLSLDNPTPMAGSGVPAITALHGALTRMLSALLTVDASSHEPEWHAMHELQQIIRELPALFEQLEDDLAAAVKS